MNFFPYIYDPVHHFSIFSLESLFNPFISSSPTPNQKENLAPHVHLPPIIDSSPGVPERIDRSEQLFYLSLSFYLPPSAPPHLTSNPWTSLPTPIGVQAAIGHSGFDLDRRSKTHTFDEQGRDPDAEARHPRPPPIQYLYPDHGMHDDFVKGCWRANKLEDSFEDARQVEHEMTAWMRKQWEMRKNKECNAEIGEPSDGNTLFGVSDPPVVKTKGNPGKNSTAQHSRNLRKCSHCKCRGHDKRTCPKLSSMPQIDDVTI
ncbi:hypothetical protein RHGRI_020562 [Rhododendron griersonianum]|uniref:CCHC-type domain-containing protein n=1 Tax=Rhododendron griersonianum TaxID=479676 RepID=A0AAV6JGU2_9ERIC|nr:hypothetical protein RHGRI_020562 [Rhododendron griersonianum]